MATTTTVGTLKIIAAVGVCAGILVAVPFVVRSERESESQTRVAAAAARQLERVDRSETPSSQRSSDLEKADLRVLIATPAPVVPDQTPKTAASEPAKTSAHDDSSDPMLLPEETLAELQAKFDAIRKLLGEKSRPILFKRFDDNLSVFISDEQKYSGTDFDEKEIYAVQMPAGGHGTYRTSLPRSEYPELYVLKDETLRLDKLIDKLRYEELLAKHKREQEAATPR